MVNFFPPQLKLKASVKTSANVYGLSPLDLDLDLCDILKNNQSVQEGKKIITAYWPEALEKLQHLVHPCPYMVSNHVGSAHLNLI
jgi:hypothetical protein